MQTNDPPPPSSLLSLQGDFLEVLAAGTLHDAAEALRVQVEEQRDLANDCHWARCGNPKHRFSQDARENWGNRSRALAEQERFKTRKVVHEVCNNRVCLRYGRPCRRRNAVMAETAVAIQTFCTLHQIANICDHKDAASHNVGRLLGHDDLLATELEEEDCQVWSFTRGGTQRKGSIPHVVDRLEDLNDPEGMVEQPLIPIDSAAPYFTPFYSKGVVFCNVDDAGSEIRLLKYLNEDAICPLDEEAVHLNDYDQIHGLSCKYYRSRLFLGESWAKPQRRYRATPCLTRVVAAEAASQQRLSTISQHW